jgi:hypothetical protein
MTMAMTNDNDKGEDKDKDQPHKDTASKERPDQVRPMLRVKVRVQVR